jgi:hypothetical protein
LQSEELPLPILLQEVRRRSPVRRKRFLGVPPAYLVYAAICSGLLAAWLVRPGVLLPTRTATIIVTPPAPRSSASISKQTPAPRPFETAGKVTLPQPELDRNPVGTIEAPRASAGFRDVQRASPENYTGFREVTSPR